MRPSLQTMRAAWGRGNVPLGTRRKPVRPLPAPAGSSSRSRDPRPASSSGHRDADHARVHGIGVGPRWRSGSRCEACHRSPSRSRRIARERPAGWPDRRRCSRAPSAETHEGSRQGNRAAPCVRLGRGIRPSSPSDPVAVVIGSYRHVMVRPSPTSPLQFSSFPSQESSSGMGDDGGFLLHVPAARVRPPALRMPGPSWPRGQSDTFLAAVAVAALVDVAIELSGRRCRSHFSGPPQPVPASPPSGWRGAAVDAAARRSVAALGELVLGLFRRSRSSSVTSVSAGRLRRDDAREGRGIRMARLRCTRCLRAWSTRAGIRCFGRSESSRTSSASPPGCTLLTDPVASRAAPGLGRHDQRRELLTVEGGTGPAGDGAATEAGAPGFPDLFRSSDGAVGNGLARDDRRRLRAEGRGRFHRPAAGRSGSSTDLRARISSTSSPPSGGLGQRSAGDAATPPSPCASRPPAPS